MTRRFAILAPLVALGGCASQPPVVVTAPPIRVHVDEASLTCLPEPGGRGVRSDRDAAVFVTRLAAAGRDCRAKLGAAASVIRAER